MSLFQSDSASLEEQRRRREAYEKWSLNKQKQKLETQIGMINRDLHKITEHIDIITPHVNNKSFKNDVRERIQKEINRLEEGKNTLERRIAVLQEDLNKIKIMLNRYS